MIKEIYLEGNSQNSSNIILKKIVVRRRQLGISQTKLATQLNLSLSGYYKIEKGKNKLDVDRLIQIAKVLQIDLKLLF